MIYLCVTPDFEIIWKVLATQNVLKIEINVDATRIEEIWIRRDSIPVAGRIQHWLNSPLNDPTQEDSRENRWNVRRVVEPEVGVF